MADSTGPAEPAWFRSVALIIGVTAPLVASIHGIAKFYTEQARAKSDETRQWIELVTRSGTSDAQRTPILRFLTESDQAHVRTWASEELTLANARIVEVQERMAAVEKASQASQTAVESFRTALEELQSAAPAQQATLRAKVVRKAEAARESTELLDSAHDAAADTVTEQGLQGVIASPAVLAVLTATISKPVPFTMTTDRLQSCLSSVRGVQAPRSGKSSSTMFDPTVMIAAMNGITCKESLDDEGAKSFAYQASPGPSGTETLLVRWKVSAAECECTVPI